MENNGKITPENELKLIVLAQNGSIEARNKLIEVHNGFLHQIAWSWHKKFPKFEVDEYFNEAVIATFSSIKSFDCSFGCRLMTYAGFAIQKHIVRFLRKRHIIKNCMLDVESFYKEDGSDFSEKIAGNFKSPVEFASNAEEMRKILKISKTILPEKQHEIIALKMQGKTFEEICSSLNISIKNVKQLFTRSMHRLMNHFGLKNDIYEIV